MEYKHAEDTRIPEWLISNLRANCSCGHPIINYYNDDDGRCTARYCSNPNCIEKLAFRAAKMLKILNIAGTKEGKSRKLIQSNGLSHHMELIPLVCAEPPQTDLSTFMRMLAIPGYDSTWVSIVGDTFDLPTLYEKLRYHECKTSLPTLEDAERYLSYFKLLQPMEFLHDAVITGNIMITGEIPGVSPRENYGPWLAYFTKGLIRLTVVGKRKTNVKALITDSKQATTGKMKVAKDCGIPYFTLDEFTEWILAELTAELQKKGRLPQEGVQDEN